MLQHPLVSSKSLLNRLRGAAKQGPVGYVFLLLIVVFPFMTRDARFVPFVGQVLQPIVCQNGHPRKPGMK